MIELLPEQVAILTGQAPVGVGLNECEQGLDLGVQLLSLTDDAILVRLQGNRMLLIRRV